MCGRVLRTNASATRRVDKPVDNADALPSALPTLSGLSPTSSTGPTTGDSHRTTPHIPSPRLPPPTVQDNICVPLKPIPTSPTGWLTPNPSGSFPYGIRLGLRPTAAASVRSPSSTGTVSGSIEGVDPQPGVPRQHVEIAVVVKHCRAGADGNRADEAVDQLANGFSLAAAGAIQGGRLVVVGGTGRENGRPREQPAKASQVAFVPGAGEHVHANCIPRPPTTWSKCTTCPSDSTTTGAVSSNGPGSLQPPKGSGWQELVASHTDLVCSQANERDFLERLCGYIAARQSRTNASRSMTAGMSSIDPSTPSMTRQLMSCSTRSSSCGISMCRTPSGQPPAVQIGNPADLASLASPPSCHAPTTQIGRLSYLSLWHDVVVRYA